MAALSVQERLRRGLKRELKGMNRAAVARKAEVHPIHLAKIMTGDTDDPRLSTVASLARALGCTIDCLLKNKKRVDKRKPTG